MKDLSFITWNIDGLGEKNRKERTKAVIQTVLERNPDVVFFQEVIPETLAWLKAALDSKVMVDSLDQCFEVSYLMNAHIFVFSTYLATAKKEQVTLQLSCSSDRRCTETAFK